MDNNSNYSLVSDLFPSSKPKNTNASGNSNATSTSTMISNANKMIAELSRRNFSPLESQVMIDHYHPESGTIVTVFEAHEEPQFIPVSEVPPFIDMLVGENGDKMERFRVHGGTPDHKCEGNCICLTEVNSKNRSSYDDNLTFSTVSRDTKSLLFGGAEDDDEIEVKTDTDTDSNDIGTESDDSGDSGETTDTEDPLTTTVEPKKPKGMAEGKKKEIAGEETETTTDDDSDEEDLGDIDDDDIEDIEEDGFPLGSSISTSDLYKMQSRVFGSSESSNSMDEGLTDQVGDALRKLESRRERRKNIFDSEEKRILGMSSDEKRTMDMDTSTEENVRGGRARINPKYK